tara:strand:- start:1160 stop:1498 length:339 start_codon:yes stop_codon:yes gene_type:complete
MAALEAFSKMFILAGITAFFGFIYMVYDKMNPNAFGFPRGKKKSLLDPFYFSFTTMSTVGYGDFSPKDNMSKMLVMAQQAVLLFEVVSWISDRESVVKAVNSALAANSLKTV